MQQRLSQNLLRLTSLLAQATGRTPWSTLQRLSGKGNLIASIEAGNTFYVATYDEILQAYSNNWPAGLVWPADIERPDPQLVVIEPVMRTKAREAAQ